MNCIAGALASAIMNKEIYHDCLTARKEAGLQGWPQALVTEGEELQIERLN